MAGGVAVWDVIGLQFLLRSHLVRDVSLNGQVMMIDASTLRLHTLVETFLAVLTCSALAEGGGSKLAFGDENPGLTFGWTCHERRTCDIFFLNALPKSCIFSLYFCLLS